MSNIALTHLCSDSVTHMVNVTAKTPSIHQVSAITRVGCSPTVMTAFRTGNVPRGDVLAVARVAGIAAAERVPSLLSLTHTIGIHGYEVDLGLEDDHIVIRSTMRTADRTGVEMKTLTSVMVCALALINMVKGVDRSACISEVKIISESGGHSGKRTQSGD